MTNPLNQAAFYKPAVFVAALLPLAWHAVGLAWPELRLLGAEPVEAAIRGLGDWALRFLLLTLAVTPLRQLGGWQWPLRLRRMLGLYCFFYAALHVGLYLVFDLEADAAALLRDIAKRPFITAGMLAFLLLIALAATSTRAMMRRLGRHWSRLHRLVYPVGVIVILHYLWMVKADPRSPLAHGAILIALLAWRMWRTRQTASGRRQ